VERNFLDDLFDELIRDGMRRGRLAGLPGVESTLALDMRYLGQTATLEVSFPRQSLRSAEILEKRFVELYQQVFGYMIPSIPTEIVAARAIVQLPRSSARPPYDPPASARTRPDDWSAYFGGKLMSCLMYSSASLAPGINISGPAIVTMTGSTALVSPDQRATVDEDGNLIISVLGENQA
jgi:N-methylhydantoinase A/oxoprolinase/acetone carboxylase beta subunit